MSGWINLRNIAVAYSNVINGRNSSLNFSNESNKMLLKRSHYLHRDVSDKISRARFRTSDLYWWQWYFWGMERLNLLVPILKYETSSLWRRYARFFHLILLSVFMSFIIFSNFLIMKNLNFFIIETKVKIRFIILPRGIIDRLKGESSINILCRRRWGMI